MQTSSSLPTSLPPLPPLYDSPSSKSFIRIVLTLLGIVIFQNILLWNQRPGLGTSLFVILLLLSFIFVHPNKVRQPKTILALILVLASAVQFTISPCWEGYFSTTILLLYLSGCIGNLRGTHVLQTTLMGGKNLLLSVIRWKWLYSQYHRLFPSSPSLAKGTSFLLQYIFRVFVPAILVCAVFGILLLSSNAILDELYQNNMRSLAQWLKHVEFPSIQRLAFSFATFLIYLGLLWPKPVGPPDTTTLENADTPCEHFVVARNLLILGGLNLLYFAANTIDGIYLWTAQALPDGISYSRFVHEGTWNLIATVVLAGILTTYLSSKKRITGFPLIKNLCLLWIAQNIFLVTSVGLRLFLYIDAYQWTLQRFYLFTFLAVVFMGFIWLAARICLGKNLFWLCEKNALTVFSLFCILQFFNVPGFIARKNVDSHLRMRPEKLHQPLDLNYLIRLGPASYPALIHFARETPTQEESIKQLLRDSLTKVPQATWQSYNMQRSRNIALVRVYLQSTAR